MNRRLAIFAFLLVLFYSLAGCGDLDPRGHHDDGGDNRDTDTVYVTLADGSIASSVRNFEVGKIYHFVVTNASGTKYDFLIEPDGSSDESQALYAHSNISPGEIVRFDLGFNWTGMFELTCHDHDNSDHTLHLPVRVE